MLEVVEPRSARLAEAVGLEARQRLELAPRLALERRDRRPLSRHGGGPGEQGLDRLGSIVQVAQALAHRVFVRGQHVSWQRACRYLMLEALCLVQEARRLVLEALYLVLVALCLVPVALLQRGLQSQQSGNYRRARSRDRPDRRRWGPPALRYQGPRHATVLPAAASLPRCGLVCHQTCHSENWSRNSGSVLAGCKETSGQMTLAEDDNQSLKS